jgi:transposase
VFVDECSTNTSLTPLYAWSRRGERAHCRVPRNWGANVTLLSSMSTEGIGPSLAVEGSTTGEVFEAYLEQVLGPTLSPGQVVVMDNLSAHKGEKVRELIEERGCELMYLPPYSPDFSPIEEAFSKIKGHLRRAQARTREALWWRRWVGRSRRSHLETRRVSLSTAATDYRLNNYDKRSRDIILSERRIGLVDYL